MTNLKSKLLAAKKRKPVTVNIFDDEYQIMRVSAARIASHDKGMGKASESANETTIIACNLILDSIVDEEGKPASETTTVDELQQSYSNGEILAAMKTILEANFDLESAKNA